MNKLIKEAIADADAIVNVAENRATSMLIQDFSPKVKNILSNMLNEEVSTGSDQPSGYSPEEDKGSLGSHPNKDLADKGAGPEKLSEKEELDAEEKDEKDEEEKKDEGSDFDMGMPPPAEDVPSLGDEEDDEENGVGDDIDDSDVLEVVNDVPPPPMPAMEAKFASVVKENKELREAIKVLHEKFNDLNVFNAKLAHAYKLMTQPGLTRDQKRKIAEAIDNAKTVREVKLIASTLLASRDTSSKNPLKNQNVRPVISESTKPSSDYTRLNELAGI
jgi:hypothetical protein